MATHPTSSYYKNNWGDANGTIYNGDKIQFGYVDSTDIYDKDLNNYNFAKIAETLEPLFTYYDTTDAVANNPKTHAVGTDIKTLLLDLIYPVGSIYQSIKDVSPATFLGGTWTKLSGQFLKAAADGDTVNTVSGTSYNTTNGGSAAAWNHNHTILKGNFQHVHGAGELTISSVQTPHKHNVTDWLKDSGSDKISLTGQRKLTATDNDGKKFLYTNKNGAIARMSETGVEYAYNGSGTITDEHPTHNHNLSGTTATNTVNNDKSTETNGGNNNLTANVANLPPYLNVYMWVRTA